MEESEQIMTLVAHAGYSHSKFIEALHAASQKDYTKYQEFINEGEEYLLEAQKINSLLMSEKVLMQPSMLMMHAQDYLMNAITLKEVAKAFNTMLER